LSFKEGVYLGGIRSVEDLRQRCRIDEETGCWHWGLAIVQGVPSVHFVVDGKRQKTKGRRASLLIAGKKIPKGHVVFARPHCKSDDCVNPDHSRSGDRFAAGAAITESGIWKGLPSKVRAAHAVWDQRERKITPEMAEEIRSSTESCYALSKRMNVSHFAIWSCRVGKSHKPKGFSVFSRGAA